MIIYIHIVFLVTFVKKNFLFCIGIQLANNVVIVPGEQRRDSQTYTCIHSPLDSAPILTAIFLMALKLKVPLLQTSFDLLQVFF